MRIAKINLITRISTKLVALQDEREHAAVQGLDYKAKFLKINEKRGAFLARVLHQNPLSTVEITETFHGYGEDRTRTLHVEIFPFSGIIPKELDAPPFPGRSVNTINADIERAQHDLNIISLSADENITIRVSEMDKWQKYLQ